MVEVEKKERKRETRGRRERESLRGKMRCATWQLQFGGKEKEREKKKIKKREENKITRLGGHVSRWDWEIF